MKKQLFLLSSLCLLFVSCETDRTTEYGSRNTTSNEASALDQGETDADKTIIQRIREELARDPNFTSDTRQIRIITSNGVVTIRGTVFNENDKNSLSRKARGVSGVKNVDNQVEIIQVEEART